MINIDRNVAAPSSLALSKMDDVKGVLTTMQYGKCYLCENDKAITYEIEHVKAKSLFPALKFEWNNLLLACKHCNSIKGYFVDKDKKNQILDCTDNKVVVKDLIQFDCNTELMERASISSKNEGPTKEEENTVKLLNSIFNSTSASKMFDAKRLTDQVTIEVKKLVDWLHKLELDAKTDKKRQDAMDEIDNLLSKEAPFTAFKISYLQKYYSGDGRFLHLI